MNKLDQMFEKLDQTSKVEITIWVITPKCSNFIPEVLYSMLVCHLMPPRVDRGLQPLKVQIESIVYLTIKFRKKGGNGFKINSIVIVQRDN